MCDVLKYYTQLQDKKFFFVNHGCGLAVFGSGALTSKMLPVRIIENNKLMLILGQVRFNKDRLLGSY